MSGRPQSQAAMMFWAICVCGPAPPRRASPAPRRAAYAGSDGRARGEEGPPGHGEERARCSSSVKTQSVSCSIERGWNRSGIGCSLVAVRGPDVRRLGQPGRNSVNCARGEPYRVAGAAECPACERPPPALSTSSGRTGSRGPRRSSPGPVDPASSSPGAHLIGRWAEDARQPR